MMMYMDVAALRARRPARPEPIPGVRLAKLSYGRFLQADPIGYGDGMNMYGYVAGDPVNGSDSSGTCASGTEAALETGSRIHHCYASDGAATGGRGPSSGYAPSAKAGTFATGVSGAFSAHPMSAFGWMVPAAPSAPAFVGPSASPICITSNCPAPGQESESASAVPVIKAAAGESISPIYFKIQPQNAADFWVGTSQLPLNARVVLSSRQIASNGSVIVNVPAGFVPAQVDSNGFGFSPPGSLRGSNLIRVMAPNKYTPYPYIVFHNSSGQPISPFSGRTIGRSHWHYPLTGITYSKEP